MRLIVASQPSSAAPSPPPSATPSAVMAALLKAASSFATIFNRPGLPTQYHEGNDLDSTEQVRKRSCFCPLSYALLARLRSALNRPRHCLQPTLGAQADLT